MPVNIQQLGRAIKQVQYGHHRAMDTALAEIGTTLTQWDALRAIARRPGASAHDLALATFQSDQAFGTLATRLVARGLIERRAGHGRRIEHHLTSDGQSTLDDGIPIAERVLGESFAGLSEHDRVALSDLLQKINQKNGSGTPPRKN